MKQKTGIIIASCALLAIALIMVLVLVFRHKKVEAPTQEVQVPVQEAITAPLKKINHNIKKQQVIVNGLTYTEAVAKYGNGYRIQFGSNCQSHPESFVISSGSTVMLDNRSNNSEVITIGDNKYNLDPYGFSIINISAPKIPTTYTMSCKAQPNVNTVIVE